MLPTTKIRESVKSVILCSVRNHVSLNPLELEMTTQLIRGFCQRRVGRPMQQFVMTLVVFSVASPSAWSANVMFILKDETRRWRSRERRSRLRARTHVSPVTDRRARGSVDDRTNESVRQIPASVATPSVQVVNRATIALLVSHSLD